jgi:O-antigen ligase
VVAGRAGAREKTARTAAPAEAGHGSQRAAEREKYDWDYLWMLAFTALLFFRPQDQIPLVGALHLSELTAIGGLAAMAVRRIGAGKSITHVNAELVGILVLGAILLLTMPFSIWPGGSMAVFTDIYVKVILIFVLMVNTITSPRRVRQMTWIMITASGYLASRAVYDYLRGVNLTEGDRVRGAVGGMFENPNDLALNLVTFLAPTLFIIFLDKKPSRRLGAGAFAAAMLAAIVCTKSRSGFLGLVGMGAVVLYYLAKVKPALIAGVALAGLMALPVVPSSFWDRMDSIVNAEEDESGSRAARLRLIDQGIEVFLENPITGIGAGQFKNYNAPGVVEKWRVTHNLWLQLATELGVFGLLTFAFLVVRAYASGFAALRMLRGPRRRGARAAPRGATAPPAARETTLDLSAEDRRILDINAKGMIAAMVGWTICAFFASVAFNWTFYYVLALAVAGREIVAARRRAAVAAPAAAPALMVRATA